MYSLEGEVDNLMRLLSFHPEFLKEFVTFYNYLMYGQHSGSLSFDMRHFIAILAAGRHKCIYLVDQQEREFLLQNGQKSWLLGVDFIPPKLKDLHELNKLLCHQPWLVNQNHIQKILKSPNGWTLTELITAITILIHFHALSGFVFGLGVHDNYLRQLVSEQREKAAQEEASQRKLSSRSRQAAVVSHAQSDEDLSENDNEEDEHDDEEDDDDEDEDRAESKKQSRSLSGDDTHEQSDDDDEIGEDKQASRFSRRASARKASDESGRARSDSTGASNRTLSDSVCVYSLENMSLKVHRNYFCC